jgi:hypothetical protein
VYRQIVDDFAYYTCKDPCQVDAMAKGDGRTTRLRLKSTVVRGMQTHPQAPTTETEVLAALAEVRQHRAVNEAEEAATDIATASTDVVLGGRVQDTRPNAVYYQVLSEVVPMSWTSWQGLLFDILVGIQSIFSESFPDCPKALFKDFLGESMSTSKVSDLAGKWHFSVEGTEEGFQDFGNAAGSILVWLLMNTTAIHNMDSQATRAQTAAQFSLTKIISPAFTAVLMSDPKVKSESAEKNPHCRRCNVLEAIIAACSLAALVSFQIVHKC